MTKTQRLINRINEKESFYDVAYVCEDFDTFIEEVAEWGASDSLLPNLAMKAVNTADGGLVFVLALCQACEHAHHL